MQKEPCSAEQAPVSQKKCTCSLGDARGWHHVKRSLKPEKAEFLVAQWFQGPALSLLRPGLLLRPRLKPWPGSFHLPRVWPKNPVRDGRKGREKRGVSSTARSRWSYPAAALSPCPPLGVEGAAQPQEDTGRPAPAPHAVGLPPERRGSTARPPFGRRGTQSHHPLDIPETSA